MGAIAFGQNDQMASVKVHVAIVNVIGILAGQNAASAKPDLAFFFVDALDTAHDPFAFRDLVFDGAGF